MSTATLTKSTQEYSDGLDSIVIVKDMGDIPGGRTLDVSGVATTVSVIKAGHILVQNDSTKSIAPLGLSSDAYVSLPSGYSYIGVLKASVLRSDPRAAILTIGQVNASACPYAITSAIKTGLPRIEFLNA